MEKVAVGVFTLVALIGVKLAADIVRSKPPSDAARLAHVVAVLAGSLLVIWAAIGDPRLWINVVIAVVIIGLGLALYFKRAKGGRPIALVGAHAGLAIVCYAILVYFSFVPAS